jgi:hypothetical protein
MATELEDLTPLTTKPTNGHFLFNLLYFMFFPQGKGQLFVILLCQTAQNGEMAHDNRFISRLALLDQYWNIIIIIINIIIIMTPSFTASQSFRTSRTDRTCTNVNYVPLLTHK